MATMTFALRGDSTNARYALGTAYGSKINSAYVTLVAGAGPLSASYIDLTDSSKVKTLCFGGYKNAANSRSFSILLRFAPNYSGAPVARRSIMQLSVGCGTSGAYLELFHEVTSGNIYAIGKNEGGAATFSTTSFGAWTTNTSGTWYDFAFLWDGTTTAGAGKLYIDGTSFGTVTATNALTASWDNTYWKSINLGCGNNSAASAYKIDEFVIWDGAIDPTSVALVGGNGSLNGASRTALVDASIFDGSRVTTGSSCIG